jgi:hypothetical protein
MKRNTFFLATIATLFFCQQANAKIWRVNNNAGIAADFTTFFAAATSASVLAGDTIHIEPSATTYNLANFTLTKRLVVIGAGYFLNPADVTTPGNAGLQVTTQSSKLAFFRIGSGADNSKFLGITIDGSVYLNTVNNISFEKVLFYPGGCYHEDGIINGTSFRKCFFNGVTLNASGTATVTNFVCENSIFYNGAVISISAFSGSGNIVRNNSIVNGSPFTLNSCYVANNIFDIPGQCTFTNCVIKNNLFQVNQTLPGTATGNQVNVNMANVYVGGTTGSFDSRTVLKAGSPAIGAGLTVGAVITPDCGAYGATDPYKLSGIPNIPSIYSLTVPTSIPSGASTMNVTFSTRNNN